MVVERQRLFEEYQKAVEERDPIRISDALYDLVIEALRALAPLDGDIHWHLALKRQMLERLLKFIEFEIQDVEAKSQRAFTSVLHRR